MSKYDPLWKYLKDNKQKDYLLTYQEIKKILGFDIDHSFLNYKKELVNYGYVVKNISLENKTVLFIKR